MAKYLMSMCLLQLPLLLFLGIKIATESLQYILNGLEIESTILSLEMKLFIHKPCKVASKQDTNLASTVEVQSKSTLPSSKIQLHR